LLVFYLLLFVCTVNAQSTDTSFIQIFSNIFSPSCGIPACHDGSFEPNFSSIASSYNTLVYHPVIKNNKDNKFRYRVIPFDSSNSVLFERLTNCCFVNENDRMPFTVGDTLTKSEINKIAKWINEGAKSPEGNIYKKPIVFPVVSSESSVLGNDTILLDKIDLRRDKLYYEPFFIPYNISTITYKFILSSSPGIGTDEDSLSVFLEFSDNDFITPPAKSIQLYNDGEHWSGRLNKKDLQKKTILFYRLRIAYPASQQIFFPNEKVEKHRRQHWSFIITK
jgi:hypothetical protein